MLYHLQNIFQEHSFYVDSYRRPQNNIVLCSEVVKVTENVIYVKNVSIMFVLHDQVSYFLAITIFGAYVIKQI